MRKKEDRRVEDVPVEEDRRVMERRSPENRKKPRFKRKGKGPDRRVQNVLVENNRRVGARRHCEAEPPQSATEWTIGLILWCHRSWKSEWKDNLVGPGSSWVVPQSGTIICSDGSQNRLLAIHLLWISAIQQAFLPDGGGGRCLSRGLGQWLLR